MRKLLLLACLAACGKSKSSAQSEPVEDCPTQTKEIAALLTQANTDSFRFATMIQPVHRSDLPKTDIDYDAFTLDVAPGTARIHYHDIPLSDLGSVLPDEKARAKSSTINLIIDPTTPFPDVLATVDAARKAGFTSAAFVFVADVKVKQLPRTAVDDELDKIENSSASEKATNVAQLAMKTIESCPAMKKVFSAVGSDEGADKAAILIEGIGEALPECKCSLDMPAFRAIMYRIIANPNPARVITVDLTNQSVPSTTIAKAMPWSEASHALSLDTKGINWSTGF